MMNAVIVTLAQLFETLDLAQNKKQDANITPHVTQKKTKHFALLYSRNRWGESGDDRSS